MAEWGFTCIGEGCTVIVSSTSEGYSKHRLCKLHYRRLQNHGDPNVVKVRHKLPYKIMCIADECEKEALNGIESGIHLCPAHTTRLVRYGDYNYQSPRRKIAGRVYGLGNLAMDDPDAMACIDGNRYFAYTLDGEWVLEHVQVMEQVKGRKMVKGENVHHKNGVRYDNRPSNLELWVTYQPSGQRPEDLLKWADEIILRYRNEN